MTCAETPATHSILLSGHHEMIWMAYGSSSTMSVLGLSSLFRDFSNTLAVFNLYSTCKVTRNKLRNKLGYMFKWNHFEETISPFRNRTIIQGKQFWKKK